MLSLLVQSKVSFSRTPDVSLDYECLFLNKREKSITYESLSEKMDDVIHALCPPERQRDGRVAALPNWAEKQKDQDRYGHK